jgi:hypothetical protein
MSRRELYYQMYKTTGLSWSRIAIELGERVETVRDGAREFAYAKDLPYPPLQEDDPRWQTYPRYLRPKPRPTGRSVDEWSSYVSENYEEPIAIAEGTETLEHLIWALGVVIGD